MICKFDEEIFGKVIPSRFGDPVRHLSQEPLLKIVFQRYLGGGSTCASAIPPLWMLVRWLYGMNVFKCAHSSRKLFCAGLARCYECSSDPRSRSCE